MSAPVPVLLAMMGDHDPEHAAAVRGEADPGPEVWAFLVRIATDFIVAGGAWSTADWREMTVRERAAAVEAGERVRAAQAVSAGRAARGGLEEAEVLEPIDGGARRQALADAAAFAELEAKAARALGLELRR